MTDVKKGPIGERVLRLEDWPLLGGEGTFAADWSFPDTLHMRVVRSNVAHGKLRSVDISTAISLPGVHTIWTAEDVSEIPKIEFRATKYTGLEPYRQPVLATDCVRYVGEPVAVVFADNLYAAEDAANQIWLDIEELPPITDATAPPGEFATGCSTEATVIEKGYGDVDAAFAIADDVVDLELRTGRHSGVPLECRGGLARINPDSGV
ncbi:MAG: xanthine dehydrogenase family protein, partial [Pseudomonadota bacterium]|nr:xanthine dehydrogenase family protein [Pseudomonadota bacterium]